MKPTHIVIPILTAAAVFVGLVYTSLRIADVAEPSATTTDGFTGRRLWATTTFAVAIVGAVLAGRGWARPRGRCGDAAGRLATIIAGGVAALSGGLVLVVADAGPGSGNGVVGGAAALVLGLMAVALAIRLNPR